jgi:hypothetical protein
MSSCNVNRSHATARHRCAPTSSSTFRIAGGCEPPPADDAADLFGDGLCGKLIALSDGAAVALGFANAVVFAPFAEHRTLDRIIRIVESHSVCDSDA